MVIFQNKVYIIFLLFVSFEFHTPVTSKCDYYENKIDICEFTPYFPTLVSDLG